ncbi:MAG: tRNA dihydrouridine synthase DusB [Gammaproteobacteria bacterium]|nr:tRNA dihydrouridine synthase DusB [Gammaproteobacteria bacterium]TVQ43976.1 MAG: tRNA dihydrouridine synthase DusB [Gammaproteobacteria bacterium]
MRIGPHAIDPPVLLAPMAGVTDKPFRVLCKRLGAGLCASEMTTADPRLRSTRKTRLRLDHDGEPAPIAVQIAGADPAMLAEAARHAVAHGAQIIDINMGCPAKKVCRAWAGSALLRDEPLVARILECVVAAVAVPVTLKIRTGWDAAHNNAVAVARIAEAAGIAAIAVHGRTREQRYHGAAEYRTIRRVKAAVSLPVIANGDIDSPAKAAEVLAQTGADAVMVGRAAQGRPWIFREMAHHLATGSLLPPPSPLEVETILLEHLEALYLFYGEQQGVRIARKHLAWYCAGHPGSEHFRAQVNRAETAALQQGMVREHFAMLAGRHAA